VPTARWIVYTRFLPNGSSEVWIARGDGTRTRRLAEGRRPAVSPDGRWVAFHGGRESRFEGGFYRDLMLIATSGGRPRLLARAAEDPVWSPDGKRVAAAQRLSDWTRALLSIDVRDGRTATLARGAIYGWSFSPTGDEVAYARAEPRPWGLFQEKVDVYIADGEGGRERRLTSDGDSAYPVWGPREIAFARIVPYRGWGAHEIWRVRPEGGGRRLITRTPRSLLGQGITGLVPVAWSANGRALLAELTNEFGGPPYAVNPETGAVRAIGDYGFRASHEALSRDGRFVLVSDSGVELSRHTRVEIVPYAGGRSVVVARRAGEASWNR
jgi:Tol biopolymer transport system component